MGVDIVIVTTDEDDSAELELISNPEFISAMNLIAQGLEESDIDWSKVKKVTPKIEAGRLIWVEATGEPGLER